MERIYTWREARDLDRSSRRSTSFIRTRMTAIPTRTNTTTRSAASQDKVFRFKVPATFDRTSCTFSILSASLRHRIPEGCLSRSGSFSITQFSPKSEL